MKFRQEFKKKEITWQFAVIKGYKNMIINPMKRILQILIFIS